MCAEQKNVIQKMIYQNHDPTDDSQDDVLEKEENGASNSSRHEQNRHGHLKNKHLLQFFYVIGEGKKLFVWVMSSILATLFMILPCFIYHFSAGSTSAWQG